MFASHCRRLRTTTLAAKERDAQLRRAAHALQRLQTSGLAAMAAGHAERQKEESLAAAVAWLSCGSARRRGGRGQRPCICLACTCVLRTCARGFF